MKLPVQRLVVWAALALAVWAAVVYATGGLRLTFFGFPVTSRDPLRPAALAVMLLAAGYAVRGRRQIDDELALLADGFGKAATPAAIAVSCAVVAAGLRWGTFAASSVDAYGYVSQAALWARGTLRVAQPLASRVSWPAAEWAFAPMGYRPTVDGHAIVPSYPAGLPLLMALAERVAGACGPYVVVPLLGGLGVWCCYLLGRRVASPAVGAGAAILLACSPAFLVHLVVPMSDVPAAALWSGALVLALRGGVAAPFSAGACAALAVLVRPNLAPLAAVVGAFIAWDARGEPNQRAAWTRAAWFTAAFVPALVAIAIINWRLYGSPASSGYGEIGAAYAIGHVAANARRYAGWLVLTGTPLIVLAVVGLLAPRVARPAILAPRAHALFLAFTLTVAASYLPYSVFEDWQYLRFFLPALPLLLVSMTATIAWALGYLPVAARLLAFLALGTLLVSHELRFAIDAGLTTMQRIERRYVAVARFVEASTPPNAVFLALQHGGSIRHYGNRPTVRFDRVSVGLDDALASLERLGWRPFILLEDWEEPQFKEQFGAASAIGRLGWRPYARLSEPGGVNIYDPQQADDAAPHELAVIPPPAGCDCRHY